MTYSLIIMMCYEKEMQA